MSRRPAAFLGLGAIGAPMAARLARASPAPSCATPESKGRSSHFAGELFGRARAALGGSADYLDAIRLTVSQASAEIRG